MLRLRRITHLLPILDSTEDELRTVLASPATFYEDLLLSDPAKPGKTRAVVNVTGPMRAYQQRLYRRLFLPKLVSSPHSHGSVPGKSIKTNVTPHLHSGHVFKTDISNFFPSVHHSRVYNLFLELECSPDVARILTKICTFRHHLALGLITSPILADQVLRQVDNRICGCCAKLGLKYTRYVDDISVSGPFRIEKSGIPNLVARILRQQGFVVNPSKHRFGNLSDGLSITSLREVRGHLDPTAEYIEEVTRQIADAVSLARDEPFVGPYFTRSQILGRVRFICWVNPGRKRDLLRRYRSIRWQLVEHNAQKRKLVVSRKTLTKAPTPQIDDQSKTATATLSTD